MLNIAIAATFGRDSPLGTVTNDKAKQKKWWQQEEGDAKLRIT